MFVALRDDSDTVYVENDAAAAVRTFTGITINQDTWYKLRVLVNGPWASIWLDGTLLGDSHYGTFGTNGDYVGLYTYNVKVDYRNIKTWTATADLPA